MSFPPQPPTGQQWPGPPQGPPQGPPPGWGPPSGPPPGPPGFPPQGPPGFAQYGGGYGGPPKKSKVGLIVGLVALAVLLIVGIAVTAVLLVGGDDEGDKKAGKDPSTTSSNTSEASPSPTDPSSATTPATPYSPTDDTGDDVHSDVKATDFPGDWNFKLGDVEHNAKLLHQWDYDTCSPVEEGSVLTQQRCEYAAQWTYSALNGKARLTHIFLVFDTERHAKAAEAKISNEDFDLRDESVFPDYVQGKYNTSVFGNLVGITVGTTKVKVNEKRLQSLVNYMNTDYRVALSFKQL